MILGVGIAVELRERGDVVGLALALGAELTRLLERRPAVDQVLGGRRREGVVEQGHRDAPIRHRALGIALQHARRRLVRGLVPERMLQLHRLVEGLLRLGRAGDRKVNRAEHRMTGMLVSGVRGRRDSRGDRQENAPRASVSSCPPWICPAGIWRRELRRGLSLPGSPERRAGAPHHAAPQEPLRSARSEGRYGASTAAAALVCDSEQRRSCLLLTPRLSSRDRNDLTVPQRDEMIWPSSTETILRLKSK